MTLKKVELLGDFLVSDFFQKKVEHNSLRTMA